MACQRCKSKRVLDFSGKTSDCFDMRFPGKEEYVGYVPVGLGISREEDGD